MTEPVTEPVTDPTPTPTPIDSGPTPSPAPDPAVTYPAPHAGSIGAGCRSRAHAAGPGCYAHGTGSFRPGGNGPDDGRARGPGHGTPGRAYVPALPLVDAALPGLLDPAPVPVPPDPVPAAEPDVPADCNVTEDRLTALQEPAPAPDIEVFGTPLYIPALDILSGRERTASKRKALPRQARRRRAPYRQHQPARTAPRPGPTERAARSRCSARGSRRWIGKHRRVRRTGAGAAWLPSPYLVIPTAGADPIRGPLQHVHSVDAADPGSSPD